MTPEEHLFEHDTGPNLRLFWHGAVAGLVGGAVFAIGQTVLAAIQYGNTWVAWRYFASIIGGHGVAESPITPPIFILGFAVHLGLSVIFGLVFGMIAQASPDRLRRNWAAHSAVGMILGLLIYLLNIQVIARAAYPWWVEMNQTAQILIHAVGYGLPVALYLTAAARMIIAPKLHREAKHPA